MKNKLKIPGGVTCLIIVVLVFGYFGYVMGLANMLNTIMNTAHDLLLNTVFYLMGICVITGALGKIFVEFGVVDLLQRLLRPVMKPLFNLPGVASLGAVLTFLSDNPAIISLSRDRHFSRYFKKYQLISLTNFGTAFGMGLIVIVFMIGQGYFLSPFVGLFGAMAGCIISTRFMQHYTCKDFPQYKAEDAISGEDMALLAHEDEEVLSGSGQNSPDSLFVRCLNSLLDGGKSGVEIGLAIIPGVLIISTMVMMLTFGGSSEGVDEAGNALVVYTGGAYEGTKLLPWLAGKISFIFKWLFGFTSPELIAFPITALGAVGAALGLIPEFTKAGIIDGNAIAVFTAMGMCWSGYLSTHTAMLDSLGYRNLLSRAFLSHFLGGLGAGVIAHWLYVAITSVALLFTPGEVWKGEASAYTSMDTHFSTTVVGLDDGSFTVKDWYGFEGEDLNFSISSDSTIVVNNAYISMDDLYFFVNINKNAYPGEPAYAALYPSGVYSEAVGDENSGYAYVFTFVYDNLKRLIDRGFFELTWGGEPRHSEVLQSEIDQAILEEENNAESEEENLQQSEE